MFKVQSWNLTQCFSDSMFLLNDFCRIKVAPCLSETTAGLQWIRWVCQPEDAQWWLFCGQVQPEPHTCSTCQGVVGGEAVINHQPIISSQRSQHRICDHFIYHLSFIIPSKFRNPWQLTVHTPKVWTCLWKQSDAPWSTNPLPNLDRKKCSQTCTHRRLTLKN